MHKCARFILVLSVLGLTTPSKAAEVITSGDGTNIVRITNFESEGEFYNIDFSGDSYDMLFALEPPLFSGDIGRATQAAYDLAALLNTLEPIPSIAGGFAQRVLLPPYEQAERTNLVFGEMISTRPFNSEWQASSYLARRSLRLMDVVPPVRWAIFPPVPEPSTASMSLFGILLATIGRSRR